MLTKARRLSNSKSVRSMKRKVAVCADKFKVERVSVVFPECIHATGWMRRLSLFVSIPVDVVKLKMERIAVSARCAFPAIIVNGKKEVRESSLPMLRSIFRASRSRLVVFSLPVKARLARLSILRRRIFTELATAFHSYTPCAVSYHGRTYKSSMYNSCIEGGL